MSGVCAQLQIMFYISFLDSLPRKLYSGTPCIKDLTIGGKKIGIRPRKVTLKADPCRTESANWFADVQTFAKLPGGGGNSTL